MVASGHVVYGVMDDMLCIACRQLLTGTFWSSDGRVLTTAPNMWSSNISSLRWKHRKCNIVITDIRSQFVLLKPKATLYWPSVKLHISYIAVGKHYCLQQIQERCIPVSQGSISGDNKRDRPPWGLSTEQAKRGQVGEEGEERGQVDRLPSSHTLLLVTS